MCWIFFPYLLISLPLQSLASAFPWSTPPMLVAAQSAPRGSNGPRGKATARNPGPGAPSSASYIPCTKKPGSGRNCLPNGQEGPRGRGVAPSGSSAAGRTKIQQCSPADFGKLALRGEPGDLWVSLRSREKSINPGRREGTRSARSRPLRPRRLPRGARCAARGPSNGHAQGRPW